MNGRLTIPVWGLWMMFAASVTGSILLFIQLRSAGQL
jgi:uncharacterized membrane protein YdjX (TVP38/TMEM64 family)